MKKTLVLCSFLLLLAGCGSRNTNKTTNTPTEGQQPKVEAAILTPAPADTITLQIHEGKATAMIRKTLQQHVSLAFDAGEYTHLEGHLTSADSTANIRFTQIFMPDGSADGPFGREISYDLSQRGTYRLLVGENMMAGDPWGGVFTVELTLTGSRAKE